MPTPLTSRLLTESVGYTPRLTRRVGSEEAPVVPALVGCRRLVWSPMFAESCRILAAACRLYAADSVCTTSEVVARYDISE
jgi:hypothetical protein